MIKATKSFIKKQRDPEKIKKVLIQKGYLSGKLPNGKELHHVKPVIEGGITSNKNTRIVTAAKHRQIHTNRKARGLI